MRILEDYHDNIEQIKNDLLIDALISIITDKIKELKTIGKSLITKMAYKIGKEQINNKLKTLRPIIRENLKLFFRKIFPQQKLLIETENKP